MSDHEWNLDGVEIFSKEKLNEDDIVGLYLQVVEDDSGSFWGHLADLVSSLGTWLDGVLPSALRGTGVPIANFVAGLIGDLGGDDNVVYYEDHFDSGESWGIELPGQPWRNPRQYTNMATAQMDGWGNWFSFEIGLY